MAKYDPYETSHFYVDVFSGGDEETVHRIEDRVSHGAPQVSDSSRLLSQITFCSSREGIRKYALEYADHGKSCIHCQSYFTNFNETIHGSPWVTDPPLANSNPFKNPPIFQPPPLNGNNS